jgi:hypothetical protein
MFRHYGNYELKNITPSVEFSFILLNNLQFVERRKSMFTLKIFIFPRILLAFYLCLGKRWHSLLRHCATSWEGAGSIPEGVNGNFH